MVLTEVKEGYEEYKPIKSPLCWAGGKSILSKIIVERFPPHITYCEPFFGAGWVLFAKNPKTSQAEFVNDLYGELSNFFRCVREKPLELIEKLRFRLISHEDYKREHDLSKNQDKDEVSRAATFFWLNKVTFGGKMELHSGFSRRSSRPPTFNFDKIPELIFNAHKRLQRVYVFNEDFEVFIDKLDNPGTLFFCFPPYVTSFRYYKLAFTPEQHIRLAEMLKNIKGKFLLSYNDCEVVRNLYSWARIEEVEARYTMKKHEIIKRAELLISNYDPPTSPKTHPEAPQLNFIHGV